MGAGFAELLLERNRSGGQIVPHPGKRLWPNPDVEPETKAFNAHGCPERRSQPPLQGKEPARIVSVRRDMATSRSDHSDASGRSDKSSSIIPLPPTAPADRTSR